MQVFYAINNIELSLTHTVLVLRSPLSILLFILLL
jgi:hypothetical protein